MSIEFGCCIPGASFMPEAPDKEEYSAYDVLLWGADEIIKCGYDYAECSVGLLMSISDEDFEKVIEKQVKIRAFNCFVPSELKIIEDLEGRLYTNKALLGEFYAYLKRYNKKLQGRKRGD